jgi:selenoprotein W-related protein
LLRTYKRDISGLELEPSGGGCFEIHVNGELVYSKLATGEFPPEPQIVELLSKYAAS